MLQGVPNANTSISRRLPPRFLCPTTSYGFDRPTQDGQSIPCQPQIMLGDFAHERVPGNEGAHHADCYEITASASASSFSPLCFVVGYDPLHHDPIDDSSPKRAWLQFPAVLFLILVVSPLSSVHPLLLRLCDCFTAHQLLAPSVHLAFNQSTHTTTASLVQRALTRLTVDIAG